MSGPVKIDGGVHVDARGAVSFVNGCSIAEAKRFYLVAQTPENPVRAWMGHRFERKWFVPVSGRTTLVLRKLLLAADGTAAMDGRCEIFPLDAASPCAIAVPAGYCSGFRSDTPHAKVLAFSDKTLDEAAGDMVRFDKDDGFDWKRLEATR